jgi:hypothetical protein
MHHTPSTNCKAPIDLIVPLFVAVRDSEGVAMSILVGHIICSDVDEQPKKKVFDKCNSLVARHLPAILQHFAQQGA